MNKNLQSPNHLQKKQEITSHQVANQILNQVPAKNLRNPDYYITSILTNPNSKVKIHEFSNLLLITSSLISNKWYPLVKKVKVSMIIRNSVMILKLQF